MRKVGGKSEAKQAGASSNKTSNSKKSGVQKTRIKEGKELSKLYESIATDVVSKELIKLENKMHLYVGELLSRSLSQYRNDVLMMESSISARLSVIEEKISQSTTKIMQIQTECEDMSKKLMGNVNEVASNLNAMVDNEQQKRIELYKKLQERDHKKKAEVKLLIAAIKDEMEKSVSSLNVDMKAQTQEINRLRENVDEMLMRRHGFIPGVQSSNGNVTASFGQGTDAGSMLANLAVRMQGLEAQLRLDGDDDSISEPVGMKKRMDIVEKQLNSMRRHVLDCEEEVRGIKGSFSASKSVPGAKHIATTEEDNDVKSLHRKLKRLAENTTRACKSLSGGLSDVQQATLNLYAWTDKAHDSFGVISEKVGFVSNVCPRAKVSNPKAAYDTNVMY